MRSERDAEFWDGFSDTYNSDDQGDAPQRIVDSLMESGAVRPDDCVMEVGSGPGTYSLLLAPRVRILVCMDSSAGMLDRLFASADELGIANMERFHKNWSDYTPPKGYDFCFASLLPGSSTDESMRRMEATARRGIGMLRSFFRSLGMPTVLEELGAKPADIPAMVAHRAEKPGGFPFGGFVKIQPADMEAILRLAIGEKQA